MENAGVTFVVDVEVSLVKELFLTKLGLLNSEFDELSCDIHNLEYIQKEKKTQIKNLYTKLNNCEDTFSIKSRLTRASNLIHTRFNIAEIQMKLNKNRKKLAQLYIRKYRLKQEIIRYNALADLYQIKLYKD